MGGLVDRGEIRMSRRERVGQADLLVKADLLEVELQVLAERGAGLLIERRKLDHHGRRDGTALQVDAVEPSEQPDAHPDLLEAARTDLAAKYFAEPFGRDELRIDRKPPHASALRWRCPEFYGCRRKKPTFRPVVEAGRSFQIGRCETLAKNRPRSRRGFALGDTTQLRSHHPDRLRGRASQLDCAVLAIGGLHRHRDHPGEVAPGEHLQP